jgi:hypothetical protein
VFMIKDVEVGYWKFVSGSCAFQKFAKSLFYRNL